MFCPHCHEYNHDALDGVQTLRQEYIFLHHQTNRDRNRGRTSVVRNITFAHKRMESRLWGQDVEQWTGLAQVHGERIRVWAWTHRNTAPATWQDIGE